MRRDMLSIVNSLRHKTGVRCNAQPAQAVQQFTHYESNSCLCIISLGYRAKRLVNKACKPYLQQCLLFILSITSFATSAWADYNSVRPLRADAFSPASVQVLRQQMAPVCSSGAPQRWATLSALIAQATAKSSLAKLQYSQPKANAEHILMSILRGAQPHGPLPALAMALATA
jgi:hypothetical protein